MLNAIKKTILYDQNAIYFGYPIEKLMEKAGRGIARVLIKKFGRGKRIGFFCGSGNNGGDGLTAARYLLGECEPEVFLISSAAKIKTPESRKNWDIFKGKKYDNIGVEDIPDNFDVIVECLFGTGVKGRPRPPYPGIIRKLNRMHGAKVTIDLPAPDFTAGLYISMMFPKTFGAEVVDIGYPVWLEKKIGVGQVKVLSKPDARARKGDNGKILIIGGSKCYHGAPLLAAKVASKIVDLVYFSSVLENNVLLRKMKSGLAEFIAVSRAEVEIAVRKCDVILMGPGLYPGVEEAELVNGMITKYPKKKFVLDAGALRAVNRKSLKPNCVLTPHAREFKDLFGIRASRGNVKRMAKKYGCVIALKGKVDYVCAADRCKINETGNPGMTKGGTGDVLAGLITGLAAKNDPMLAASAGVFINGLAGDRLAKRVGYYYGASDLIREIPRTIKWCEEL